MIIASNNLKKLKEINEILTQFNIEAKGLLESGIEIDIEETGSTFEENALIKAKTIYKLYGVDTIADDSGLCVDALNGEPGVYSARYAGENKDEKACNKKLLENLKDVELKKRTARFVSAIAYAGKYGEFVVRGECEGVILFEEQGENGFGYDPLFYYEDLKKTFAQMTSEEKNKVSHRKKALKEFEKRFSAYVNK